MGKEIIIKAKKRKCDSCKKHYIWAIPMLNLYQDACRDNLEPKNKCKGYERRD